jgi:hypothetical protein
MLKYLGVTTTPGTDEIQIICSQAAEAQALADELSLTFDLRGKQKPEVVGDKIIYSGNIWLLRHFLSSRRWTLTMDTKTRLMFDKPA